MENDYKYQQSTNESIINEMEKRLVDLRSNIEHLQQIKQKLNDEKNQLIKNNEKLLFQVF
jgi:TolA-binding protein